MIAFRSKAVSQINVNGTSLAVSVPAGRQAGDVLLCWIYLNAGSGTTITRPAGWNLVKEDGTAGSGGKIGLYWRLADGTEPATYTWTWNASSRGLANMSAYTGISPTSPVGLLQVVKPTSGTTLPLPAKTVALDNSWLATMAGAWFAIDAGGSFTIDAGTDVERSDDMTVGGTSGSRPALAVYDTNATVTRGTTYNRTVTMSTSNVSNQSQIAWWADLISDETTGTGPIAFRGAVSGAVSFGSAVNLNASFVQDGDLILAFVNRSGGTLTLPAGFTRLPWTPSGSIENSVYYKIANGEPSTLTFTIGGTNYMAVGLVAYSGANTSSPIGAWAANEASATPQTPTITTRTEGSWILSAAFKNAAFTGSNGDASDVLRANQSAAGTALIAYDSNRTYPAGSSVNRTLNVSGSTSGTVRFIAEIRPGIIDTGPHVTFNHREGAAWVEYTGVPKAWTVGGWVEAPGTHWDGTAWLDLPS
jgi:hypothetical protein